MAGFLKELMIHRSSKLISFFLVFCLSLSVFAFSAADAYASSSGSAKYIAHRGWSWRAPENTIPAFKLAAKKKGFYGVEFDVWEASYSSKRDPLLLVMHDQNIYKMCGVNRDIRKIGRNTLKKYRIRNGYNISKYKGLRIPTAEQALDAIYDNSRGAIPVIELKHRLSKRALKYLLKYLDGREAVIISFDFNAVADTVKMAKKLGISDSIQTMYLMSWISGSYYSSTIRKMKSAGIGCVSIKYPYINRQTVKAFHKAKIEVSAWTLPDRSTARTYVNMGVDYITANGPVW